MVKKTFQEALETELEKLPTEGPLTRQDVDVWAWWHLRLVNCLEELNTQYRGETVKVQAWATLLVVKGTVSGVPVVAFVTERDTTHCMRIFRRMVEERRVDWKEDKFGRI